MSLKSSDIETLVELFDASEWQEMHLEIGGQELFLSKSPGARPAAASAAPAPAAPAPAPAPAAGAQPAPPAADAATPQDGWVAIEASNLGTFYRAPDPDAPPYVTEGARVAPETEVCLIEVMKLFTTIRAGVTGTVRRICVEDAAMVEYGQTLMWIEPD